jgi:hypothetical protein
MIVDLIFETGIAFGIGAQGCQISSRRHQGEAL